MSTCSNHAERFHGVVNQHLKPRETLPERFHGFGDHRYDKVMGILAQLKGIPAPQTPVCFEPDCVNYVQLMQCRFGVFPFPCKHTVNAWRPQRVMAFPPRPVDLPAESIHRSTIIQNHKRFAPKFLTVRSGPKHVPSEDRELPTGDDPSTWPHDVNPYVPQGISEWELSNKRVVFEILRGIMRIHPLGSAFWSANQWSVAVDIHEDLKKAMHDAEPGADPVQIAGARPAMWWAWDPMLNPRPLEGESIWSLRPHDDDD
jgi:hypothetical protein